jgi:hypothetical protein
MAVRLMSIGLLVVASVAITRVVSLLDEREPGEFIDALPTVGEVVDTAQYSGEAFVNVLDTSPEGTVLALKDKVSRLGPVIWHGDTDSGTIAASVEITGTHRPAAVVFARTKGVVNIELINEVLDACQSDNYLVLRNSPHSLNQGSSDGGAMGQMQSDRLYDETSAPVGAEAPVFPHSLMQSLGLHDTTTLILQMAPAQSLREQYSRGLDMKAERLPLKLTLWGVVAVGCFLAGIISLIATRDSRGVKQLSGQRGASLVEAAIAVALVAAVVIASTTRFGETVFCVLDSAAGAVATGAVGRYSSFEAAQICCAAGRSCSPPGPTDPPRRGGGRCPPPPMTCFAGEPGSPGFCYCA